MSIIAVGIYSGTNKWNTEMVPVFAALLLLANLNVVAAVGSVGLTCTAAGNECGTTIVSLYCDTVATPKTCKCGDIYNAGTTLDTTCTGKTCTADSTCIALDPNSVCVSGKCACATTFESSNANDIKLCQAKKFDSACTAAGDCDAIPGAYCDSATSKCKCGALYTAGTAAALGTCVATACLTATGTTTCAVLDTNSRCANLKCDCKNGYDVYGSSTKCQSAGSVGLMASASMLAAGVVLTILSF